MSPGMTYSLKDICASVFNKANLCYMQSKGASVVYVFNLY